MTLPCAARSTLVYLERGDAPRCTKALSPFNQTSWQEMWCPGVILGPSNTQLRVSECLMWDYYMILSQLNGDPCPAWTTERGKLKRGWSPGDSSNLVRVLSVRVNYSQQCRNDINGRWEYSKSIMFPFDDVIMEQRFCNTPRATSLVSPLPCQSSDVIWRFAPDKMPQQWPTGWHAKLHYNVM